MDKEDVVHTYKKNYSTIKKKKNAICSTMDGSRDYHTKGSKSDWERQILYVITYMWNLIKKNVCILKRNRLTDTENKVEVTSGKRKGGRWQDGVWN